MKTLTTPEIEEFEASEAALEMLTPDYSPAQRAELLREIRQEADLAERAAWQQGLCWQ